MALMASPRFSGNIWIPRRFFSLLHSFSGYPGQVLPNPHLFFNPFHTCSQTQGKYQIRIDAES